MLKMAIFTLLDAWDHVAINTYGRLGTAQPNQQLTQEQRMALAFRAAEIPSDEAAAVA